LFYFTIFLVKSWIEIKFLVIWTLDIVCARIQLVAAKVELEVANVAIKTLSTLICCLPNCCVLIITLITIENSDLCHNVSYVSMPFLFSVCLFCHVAFFLHCLLHVVVLWFCAMYAWCAWISTKGDVRTRATMISLETSYFATLHSSCNVC